MQNVEPVLRACPELQKLNLASCRMLGENALDALLPAASGSAQMLSQTQVISSSLYMYFLFNSALARPGREVPQCAELHLDMGITLPLLITQAEHGEGIVILLLPSLDQLETLCKARQS